MLRNTGGGVGSDVITFVAKEVSFKTHDLFSRRF